MTQYTPESAKVRTLHRLADEAIADAREWKARAAKAESDRAFLLTTLRHARDEIHNPGAYADYTKGGSIEELMRDAITQAGGKS